MTERLVTCFRWFNRRTPAAEYLAVAAEVAQALMDIGGQPISWSADRYSFAFSRSMVREVLAVTLRLMARHSALGVAMAMRELVQDAGRSWGPGLSLSEGLATAVRRGEILFDPAIDVVSGQLIATVGEVEVEIGGLTMSAALMLAGAAPVAGVRSSLPPDVAAEPLSWRTSAPRATSHDLSPAAELLTSPEPVNAAPTDPTEEPVELSSSVVDSAVPTPNALERAIAYAEQLAQTAGPISVDEDRPTLADSPRASSQKPVLDAASNGVGPEHRVQVNVLSLEQDAAADHADDAATIVRDEAATLVLDDASTLVRADEQNLSPAAPERRTLPSSGAPPNNEIDGYTEPAPGTLPSSELLDVPSRVTPVGPPPLLHRSHAPAALDATSPLGQWHPSQLPTGPAHPGLVHPGPVQSSNPPAQSSLPPDDRSSQMRPPPKPSTRSSAPDLPAYPMPAASTVPPPVAVISMPSPRVSAPPPKPAGKSRAPARRLSEPPPKPSRTPSDADAERTSAIEALLADETSALRDRPLGTAAADRVLERELEQLIDLDTPDGEGELGLLRLREAARAAQLREAPHYARARLAVAAALGRSGNARDAYLESLLALARARETRDTAAVRASARLIAELTRRAGFSQAAGQWDELSRNA